MAIKLDLDSAHAICDGATQVMVYGFQHCRYTQVTEALKSEKSPFKKIYDCSIGGPFAPEEVMTTLEGKRLKQIPIPYLDQQNVVRELKQYCKAGLANMVIENVKRARQGLELIPVLFIVDIDGNNHPLTPDSVSNKQYTFVTMGELRRAYKLCNDPGLHPKVRAIANATFKFVQTCQHHDDGVVTYSLKQIAPFWQQQGWSEAWETRLKQSAEEPRTRSQKHKSAYWRGEVNASLTTKL